MGKRIFLIILDSFGIGELPDAKDYHDEGSNTIRACADTGLLNVPNMEKLGLFNIPGVTCGKTVPTPLGCYGRLAELSAGKDTTTGHWEIAGLISEQAMPTYPNGFPKEIIQKFEEKTGRKTICNKTYSGTDVIRDYGEEHVKTGSLIVYTSADSVFQIAAHEDVVSIDELYKYCEIARELLCGEHAVGRVIARPFNSTHPFTRTANRRDFSLLPPKDTVLDKMMAKGLSTIGVGKISDIFATKGISKKVVSHSNDEGMNETIKIAKEQDFNGLCFVNLVDFDMKYGHRNDAIGYANALNEFDKQLGIFMEYLRPDDVLLITADHGCDPSTPSTDHSREYVPLIVYGKGILRGVNLGTRKTFADIASSLGEWFDIAEYATQFESFVEQITR